MTHITTDQNEEPIVRLAYNLGVEVGLTITANAVFCNDRNPTVLRKGMIEFLFPS